MESNLFKLYCLFTTSWFLHLPARLSFLGTIRFDLILIVVIVVGIFLGHRPQKPSHQPYPIKTVLTVLVVYILLETPFAQWPGSVVKFGIPNFIKAVVFFYFTVALVNTERQLKTFLLVFIGCQIFRVLEPLYLHVVDGYWGSMAYMDGAYMDRLAGAPSDVVNPNGLAFVICTIIPFLYFAARSLSSKAKLLVFALYPLLGYALLLTASRTGLLAFGVVLATIFFRSKKKMVMATVFATMAAFTISNMTDLQKERYLSLGEKDVRGSATAEARIAGVIKNFELGMSKPLLGHGLGTSRELNFNYGGMAQPAHNLYAEIFQELGAVGLLIFLHFIWTLFLGIRELAKSTADTGGDRSPFLNNIALSLEAWFYMNLLFSLASFGLSSYEWYLSSGLVITIKNITK